LKRITRQKGSQPKQDAKPCKAHVMRSSNVEAKRTSDTGETSITPSAKRDRRSSKSKRIMQSASMVQRDLLFDTYKRERESSQKGSRVNAGINVPQHSYLGRFNDMLKWYANFFVIDIISPPPSLTHIEVYCSDG
jgi:hypothetical protein